MPAPSVGARRPLSALAWLVAVGGAGTAAGQSPPVAAPGPPPAAVFQLQPLPHAVLCAGLLATVGIMQQALAPSLGVKLGCLHELGGITCSAARLPAIDRASLGWSSRPWRLSSDVLQWAAVAAPIGAALVEHGHAHRWGEAGRDILVGVEALAIANFINTTLKFAVRRPRPGLFFGPAAHAGAELSFPSGHVATVAAATAAYATTFFLRHPRNRWRPLVAGGAVAATGLTALGRVLGGMHFPTDVLAGAGLGAAIGGALPCLLRAHVEVRPLWAAAGGEGGGVAQGIELAWRI